MKMRTMAALLLAVTLCACGPKPEQGGTATTTTGGTGGTTTTTTTTTAGTESPAAVTTPAAGETPAMGGTPAVGETPAMGETPATGTSPAAAGGAVAFASAPKDLPGYADVEKMTLEITPNPEAVARGKEIFMGTGTCNSCHGDTGQGDGPAGAALDPKPRNLAHASEYKWGADAKGVFRTAYYGGMPGSPMQPFGEKAGGVLTEDQVKDVAAFVLSLQQP